MENQEFFSEGNEPASIPQAEASENSESATDTPSPASPSTPVGVRILSGAYDLVELFTLAGAIILILFTFIFRLSIVDGGSMEQTLHDGDRVLTSALFYTPQVGDIVVVQHPTDLSGTYPSGATQTHDAGKSLIKRVIAVAGDEVRVEGNGRIFVNDQLSDESYVFENELNENFPQFTITVPEGMVFVAGDHRNASFDSRLFGPVDIRCIQGRAFLRLSPDFGSL